MARGGLLGRVAAMKTVQDARNFAAQTERDLIAALETGKLKANDPASWIKKLKQSVADIEAGKCDGNFTVWQRMNYFLTGECVPLLAPTRK